MELDERMESLAERRIIFTGQMRFPELGLHGVDSQTDGFQDVGFLSGLTKWSPPCGQTPDLRLAADKFLPGLQQSSLLSAAVAAAVAMPGKSMGGLVYSMSASASPSSSSPPPPPTSLPAPPSTPPLSSSPSLSAGGGVLSPLHLTPLGPASCGPHSRGLRLPDETGPFDLEQRSSGVVHHKPISTPSTISTTSTASATCTTSAAPSMPPKPASTGSPAGLYASGAYSAAQTSPPLPNDARTSPRPTNGLSLSSMAPHLSAHLAGLQDFVSPAGGSTAPTTTTTTTTTTITNNNNHHNHNNNNNNQNNNKNEDTGSHNKDSSPFPRFAKHSADASALSGRQAGEAAEIELKACPASGMGGREDELVLSIGEAGSPQLHTFPFLPAPGLLMPAEAAGMSEHQFQTHLHQHQQHQHHLHHHH
ncbi:unnamed protein product, partial [Protopolystoma xenopodis]